MVRAVDARLMEALILGQGDWRRQLQDFPVLGDVWAELAAAPGGVHDLLISPHRDVAAARVARVLAAGVGAGRQVSVLDRLVAARLGLDEICDVVLPATAWWQGLSDALGADWPSVVQLEAAIGDMLLFEREGTIEVAAAADGRARPVLEYEALARLGLILGVLRGAAGAEDGPPVRSLQEMAGEPGLLAVAREGAAAIAVMRLRHLALRRAGTAGVVFSVWMNRRVEFAVERSVPTIKADAARRLFDVRCAEINWAVLDSGIDATHPAFALAGAPGKTRIRATFDFGRIRDILDTATHDDRGRAAALAAELATDGFGEAVANGKRLARIGKDMRADMALDWGLVRPLIERMAPVEPEHPHGTHVAGILGGHWVEPATATAPERVRMVGVCPDIWLYDFRVLGAKHDQTEFAVIAALQFIQHLNAARGSYRIHGVNMSLSIPHNVRNYACGRTPVCDAADALVAADVVVVAAAGNRGYQRYALADGKVFESYAPSSITDPGNAERVITVGATHRYQPHSYGVSFFSGRGPTGDGRMKPDLLAPGERIESAVPGRGLAVMDGTSMAAPHVSGAAALIMARHREFREKPDVIKAMLCDHAISLGRERSFQGHGMVDVLSAMQSR